jgi:hypothetical protein
MVAFAPSDRLGTFRADSDEDQAQFDKVYSNFDKQQKTVNGLAVGTFAAIIVVCVLMLVIVPIVTFCILRRRQKTRQKRIDSELAAAAKAPASVAVPAVSTQGRFPGPQYPHERQEFQNGPARGQEMAGGRGWQQVETTGGRV